MSAEPFALPAGTATFLSAELGGPGPLGKAGGDEALGCALDTERELGGQGLPLLRVGLHSGEARLGGEVGYLGPAIARAARLVDLGHPGQVLVSRACADLVAGHLPPGASLTPTEQKVVELVVGCGGDRLDKDLALRRADVTAHRK
jgi:class 3 adenylate cyclase